MQNNEFKIMLTYFHKHLLEPLGRNAFLQFTKRSFGIDDLDISMDVPERTADNDILFIKNIYQKIPSKEDQETFLYFSKYHKPSVIKKMVSEKNQKPKFIVPVSMEMDLYYKLTTYQFEHNISRNQAIMNLITTHPDVQKYKK